MRAPWTSDDDGWCAGSRWARSAPASWGAGGDDPPTSAPAASPTTTADAKPSTTPDRTTDEPAGEPTDEPADEPTDPPPDGVVAAAKVPVGSGVILTGPKLVVTQPRRGTFKAFSSICTHAGCPVTAVNGAEIECPCHGSRFSVEDGSVLGGPAPAPLAEQPVRVRAGQVLRG